MKSNYPSRSKSLAKYLGCLLLAVIIATVALINLKEGSDPLWLGFFVGGVAMAMRETALRMRYKKSLKVE